MSALMIQLLTAFAASLVSGLGVHLWHTSAAPATPGTPAAPSTSAAPLFPSHPIASQALTTILHDAEQAALAAARQVFNAQLPTATAPPAPSH